MEEKDNICRTGSWLDAHMSKLFDQYYIDDPMKRESDPLLEKDFGPWKVIVHE